MQRPSFYTTHNAIRFSVGCLLLSMGVVTGAHAEEPTLEQERVPASAPAPPLQSVAVTVATGAAAIDVVHPTAPVSLAARDLELIRAHRMERRMMISESTGISLGEVDDLLRKIGPTVEERDNDERRTQTGQISVKEIDENP